MIELYTVYWINNYFLIVFLLFFPKYSSINSKIWINKININLIKIMVLWEEWTEEADQSIISFGELYALIHKLQAV